MAHGSSSTHGGTTPARRSVTRVAAIATAAAAFLALAVSPGFADDATTITLLDLNDFHGRIALDEDPSGVNTVRFAGTIEQLRDAYGRGETLLLSGGDNVGASLFASAIEQDDPTLDVLKALGLAVSAVGNHEFDQGLDDLLDRIVPRGGFPYLGANVYRAGTFEPVLPEYQIIHVAGHRVGVIGAVTQETGSLVNPAGVKSIEFGDPVDAVNRVAGQLTNDDEADGEAEILVAEYHEGAPVGADQGGTLESNVAASPVFAKLVNGTDPTVDVILTGHTHQAYAWLAPVPGDPGRTRPVLQTGSYAQHVGVVRLTVGPAGNVITATVENADLTTMPVSQLIATYPAVADVDRIVTDAVENAAAVGGQQIGSIAADISTAFSGGAFGPKGWEGGQRDDRSRESSLGSLVADALLASLSDPARGGADFAVVNPGGLRADLLMAAAGGADAGAITYQEANSVLPFGNDLWTTTLSGATVKELLEQQWQRDANGDVPSRPYLALALSSNVGYTYDPTRAEGDRITSIEIGGKPVDPAGSYRLGTWAFLTSGGDNFRAAAQGTDARDSGLLDRDAWVAYLAANVDLAPNFAKSGASVTGLPATVQPGDTLALTIGDLDLTSLGAPRTTSLDVEWSDSTAFRTATVAPTDGDAYAVTITVPTDALAASTLVITAHPGGTVVRIPITIAGGAVTPPPVPVAGSVNWLGPLLGGLGIVLVLGIAFLIAARSRRRGPAARG